MENRDINQSVEWTKEGNKNNNAYLYITGTAVFFLVLKNNGYSPVRQVKTAVQVLKIYVGRRSCKYRYYICLSEFTTEHTEKTAVLFCFISEKTDRSEEYPRRWTAMNGIMFCSNKKLINRTIINIFISLRKS